MDSSEEASRADALPRVSPRAEGTPGDRRPVSGVQASPGFSLAMRRGAAELDGPKAVDHRVRACSTVLDVGYLQGSATACRHPGGYWKAQRQPCAHCKQPVMRVVVQRITRHLGGTDALIAVLLLQVREAWIPVPGASIWQALAKTRTPQVAVQGAVQSIWRRLPAVRMHASRIILRAWLLRLPRMPNGDVGEGDDRIRNAQDPACRRDPLLSRVHAAPDGPKPQANCSQEDVLCGGRQVLDPIVGELRVAPVGLSAGDDAERCLGQHLGVRMSFRQGS